MKKKPSEKPFRKQALIQDTCFFKKNEVYTYFGLSILSEFKKKYALVETKDLVIKCSFLSEFVDSIVDRPEKYGFRLAIHFLKELMTDFEKGNY